MKKIIITAFSIIISLPIFAQLTDDAAQKLMVRNIEIDQINKTLFGLTNDEIKATLGSPYANPSFLQGSIYQGDKLVKKDVMLRYNSYSDEIEIKKTTGGDGYYALYRNDNLFVKIFETVYIFVPLKGNIENGGYFSIVSTGKHYDLYKKQTTKYTKPYRAKTTLEQDRAGRFVTTNSYYLVSKSGIFIDLPLKKKKILEIMEEKKSEVKEFIKINNIDLDNESNLITLVQYYNSLF